MDFTARDRAAFLLDRLRGIGVPDHLLKPAADFVTGRDTSMLCLTPRQRDELLTLLRAVDKDWARTMVKKLEAGCS